MRIGHLVAAALALATPSLAGAAGEGSMRATVGRPAVLPVRPGPSGTAGADGRHGRLVVTVVGYVPSSDGPVSGVVSVRCGAAEMVVGRFGVFPNLAFAPGQPDRAQRYGFAMPACAGPASAVVSVEPTLGTGRDAVIEVAEAVLE